MYTFKVYVLGLRLYLRKRYKTYFIYKIGKVQDQTARSDSNN